MPTSVEVPWWAPGFRGDPACSPFWCSAAAAQRRLGVASQTEKTAAWSQRAQQRRPPQAMPRRRRRLPKRKSRASRPCALYCFEVGSRFVFLSAFRPEDRVPPGVAQPVNVGVTTTGLTGLILSVDVSVVDGSVVVVVVSGGPTTVTEASSDTIDADAPSQRTCTR